MAKTSYRTWVTGETVTAQQLNEQIRDNGNEIWKGTTAGDMDYYTSATTKDRIAIGGNGQVLQVESGVPTWKGSEYCAAGLYTDTSIPHNITTTPSLSTVDFDPNGWFNTDRIYVPVSGWYLITGYAKFYGHASSGTLRLMKLVVQTTSIANSSGVQSSDGDSVELNCAVQWYCNTNDMIRVSVFQKSGGDLNVDTIKLQVARIK